MYKVCVLMSSYNGEKYIERQILDILNQKKCAIHLLIRDDGSSDDTVKIIKSLAKNDTNIELIIGENIGWKKSFKYLLRLSNKIDSEYYAFADQDDEWDEDKIICAIKKISRFDKDQAVLYTSNLRVKHDDIEPISMLYKNDQIGEKFAKYSVIGSSPFGCSMVWNYNLNKIVSNNIPKKEVSHDIWMHMVAHLFGKVYFDNDAHMNHIVHSDNACGVAKNNLEKIEKFFKIYLSKKFLPCSEYIAEIDRIWGIKSTNFDDKDFLYDYMIYRKNLKARINILRSRYVKNMHREFRIRFIFFILINKG